MRVMIADDDRELAASLAGFVEACGHEVAATVTTGGLDVIHQFNQLRPDCVLMDIMMPRFNGLTVCHALLSKDPEAKVILLSGKLSSEHPFLRNSGAAAFLSKPLRMSDLRDTFDRIEHMPMEPRMPRHLAACA